MADSCTCGQLSTGRTAYHDFVYELLTAEGCAASNGLRDHSLNVLHCLIPRRVVSQLQALLIHPCHAHRQVLCVPAPMPQRSSDTLSTTLPHPVAHQDGPPAPGTPCHFHVVPTGKSFVWVQQYCGRPYGSLCSMILHHGTNHTAM